MINFKTQEGISAISDDQRWSAIRRAVATKPPLHLSQQALRLSCGELHTRSTSQMSWASNEHESQFLDTQVSQDSFQMSPSAGWSLGQSFSLSVPDISCCFNHLKCILPLKWVSTVRWHVWHLSDLKRFWVLGNCCSSTPPDGTHRSYEKPKTLALSLVRLVCSVLVASNTLASPTMGCGANLGQFL